MLRPYASRSGKPKLHKSQKIQNSHLSRTMQCFCTLRDSKISLYIYMFKIARFVGCFLFFFCIYFYSSENAMLCYCVCCDYNGIAYIPSLLQRKGDLQTKVRKMAGNKPNFLLSSAEKKKKKSTHLLWNFISLFSEGTIIQSTYK